MSTRRFIQYVAGSKNKLPTVYLQCRVKPGASKVREGVAALTDDAVELCVTAAAREGEANKAVLAVLSEVLGVPKSDLQITRGMKSRDKTVAVGGRAVQQGEEECLKKLLKMLSDAVDEDSG
ncbi:hypothetical protein M406DRAFT_341214 [Cryphonectria parasitica EP155]|uniref:Uncharacterized protein n=1 Tax=Cryphonectria parasitica (strain ATCC 38755 / EP155) TaxID=660469 RepID=A0A9P4XYQ5_CRYP1|nr:uncharacterized protein M406DRAFT_341214 [Cryphonectria parasitica EP155]KAF3763792.1 hypothetical protein M406DRAFT_341214 [Cryphonectria parasitica EP155]